MSNGLSQPRALRARAADHRRRPVFSEGVARWPLRILAVDSPTGLAACAQEDGLLDAGFELSSFADGTSALICMSAEDPAVILAPTEILGVDFTSFVETVTELTTVPVIVGLTGAPGSQERAYHALELGARALVALPAGPEQLTAMTRQLGVRRSAFATPCGHALISIDPKAQRVEVDGKAVNLSLIELRTLKILAEAAPNAVPHQELAELLSTGRHISVAHVGRIISRIRVKLATAAPEEPDSIETVRSLGYRLRP